MSCGPEVLSIGVDTYFLADGAVDQDATLMYAADDAVIFSQKAKIYFNSDLFGVVADTRDIGVRPTRNNIFVQLERLKNAETSDRPGLFYFSGHGVVCNEEFSLCPTDFVREISAHSCIPLQHVADIYSERYPWSLLVVDACRMSPNIGVKTERFTMPSSRFLIRDNVIIVCACSAGQSAIELARIGNAKGGSIFSHFFWKEVKKASSEGRDLSVRILFESVRDRVSSYVNRKFVGNSQVPVIYGADYDRFFLPSNNKDL